MQKIPWKNKKKGHKKLAPIPILTNQSPSVNHFDRKSKTTQGISCIYYNLRLHNTLPDSLLGQTA